MKAVIGDDGMIGNADQIVDEGRRRLTPEQVLAHDSNRHLGKQELGAAQFVDALSPEGQLGEFCDAGLDLPGLRRNPIAQMLRPSGLTEIVAVIEQQ